MKKITLLCIVIVAVSVPSLVFADGDGPMAVAGADAGHALDVAGSSTAQVVGTAGQDAWTGLKGAAGEYKQGWKDTQGDPVGTSVDGTARVVGAISKGSAIGTKDAAVIVGDDYKQAFKDHMSNDDQKDVAHAAVAVGAGTGKLGKDIGHGFKHLFAHFHKNKKKDVQPQSVYDGTLVADKNAGPSDDESQSADDSPYVPNGSQANVGE